ncbi:Uncharacterized protein Fot_04423 [Forsythia ovata]|uniref:Uncharacterized protein n=1 Tax=Forsythia ovata TaxID=205694 RepID=A0ABD1XCM6_9LAMI
MAPDRHHCGSHHWRTSSSTFWTIKDHLMHQEISENNTRMNPILRDQNMYQITLIVLCFSEHYIKLSNSQEDNILASLDNGILVIPTMADPPPKLHTKKSLAVEEWIDIKEIVRSGH